MTGCVINTSGEILTLCCWVESIEMNSCTFCFLFLDIDRYQERVGVLKRELSDAKTQAVERKVTFIQTHLPSFLSK